MNILMLAFRFPPSASSGAFRPMYFAIHLHEMGEHVYVLTAREQDDLPEQPKDYNLLEKLDPGIEIFPTRVFRPQQTLLKFRELLAKKTTGDNKHTMSSSLYNKTNHVKRSRIQELKDIITDSLSIPDVHIGWLPSAVRTGRQIVKNKCIDIIYATGAPWTSLIVGVILRKLTGKPLVLDFRDPWVTNPSPRLNSTLMRSLEPFIERAVVSAADHIVSNTAELQQDFQERYPSLLQHIFTTIPNGFEEYIESQTPKENKMLTFTHAGTLYFSRNPCVLLQAILNLLEKKILPKEECKFVFLGGIDISIPDANLRHLLQNPLLQEVIDILPRLPYQEAIHYQSFSDVLLLIQPGFPLQIPRKLYEYIAFRKTILAITDVNGATAKIIQEKQLGIVVENQIEAIESALKELYSQWKSSQMVPLSTETCDEFMNKNLTVTLHQIFQKCLSQSSQEL